MHKTANLLEDGFGAPARVGLLLPLHWQLVCFLLGAAATGAEVVVASAPEHLAGCGLAFVQVDAAEAALDAGVEDVLAVSGHPLGARLPAVPPLVLDAAVEVPTYGDRYPGSPPAAANVLLDEAPFAVPDLGLGPADRVLTTLAPGSPEGLGVLLSALRAGSGLVLVAGPADLAAVASAEQVTATAGATVAGLRRLDGTGQAPGRTQDGAPAT